MSDLNYNHLRYFWAVAHDRNLTRTAQRLNVSQSALSVQIRKLEERLGLALFERRGRQLHLTEAGADRARPRRRDLRHGARSARYASPNRDDAPGGAHRRARDAVA